MALWAPALKPNPEATRHGRITITDRHGNLLRVEDADTSGTSAPCRMHGRRGCQPCYFTRPPLKRAKVQAMSRMEG